MSKRRRYTELPDLELDRELDARIREMTERADRDIADLHDKAKVEARSNQSERTG